MKKAESQLVKLLNVDLNSLVKGKITINYSDPIDDAEVLNARLRGNEFIYRLKTYRAQNGLTSLR